MKWGDERMNRWKFAIALLIFVFIAPEAKAERYVDISTLKDQADIVWREQLTDRYGRTISVDVAPMIDDVESVPVLGMDSPVITAENIYNVFPREEVSVTVSNGTIDYEYADGERTVSMWIANPDNPTYPTGESRSFYIQSRRREQASGAGASGLVIDEGMYRMPDEVDVDAAYLDGSGLTVRQCLRIAGERLAAFFPDCDFGFSLFRFSVIGAKTPYYSLSVRQKAHGLPILTSARDCVLNVDRDILGFDVPDAWRLSYNMPWGEFRYPGWELAMSDSLFQIFCRPLREGEVLADDVPLCDMADVIESIRERIEAGYIRNVHSLRFGYCCFLDEREEIVLYPVWAVECDYMFLPEKEMRVYEEHAEGPVTSGLYDRIMVVNAQTGAFIDPAERKDALFDCPEIVTWEAIR